MPSRGYVQCTQCNHVWTVSGKRKETVSDVTQHQPPSPTGGMSRPMTDDAAAGLTHSPRTVRDLRDLLDIIDGRLVSLRKVGPADVLKHMEELRNRVANTLQRVQDNWPTPS